MPICKYQFNDGTVSEVEVSDELYATLNAMDKQEELNNRKNTRRHVSLDYMNTFDLELEAPDSNPLIDILKKESQEEVQRVIKLLSPKQQELVEYVFFKGLSLTAIAELEHVSQQAISQRIATIYKKLKNLL